MKNKKQSLQMKKNKILIAELKHTVTILYSIEQTILHKICPKTMVAN